MTTSSTPARQYVNPRHVEKVDGGLSGILTVTAASSSHAQTLVFVDSDILAAHLVLSSSEARRVADVLIATCDVVDQNAASSNGSAVSTNAAWTGQNAVSVKTAAELTDLSESTIRIAIQKQQLRSVRLGTMTRVMVADLQAWIGARR